MVAERKDATAVVEPRLTQTLQDEVKDLTDKIREVMMAIEWEQLPPDEAASQWGTFHGMEVVVEVMLEVENEPAAEITPERLEKYIKRGERARALMGTRYLAADQAVYNLLNQYRKRVREAKARRREERRQHANTGQIAQ